MTRIPTASKDLKISIDGDSLVCHYRSRTSMGVLMALAGTFLLFPIGMIFHFWVTYVDFHRYYLPYAEGGYSFQKRLLAVLEKALDNPWFWIFLGIAIVPLCFSFFKTVVEIDRKQGTVKKRWQILFFRISKSYKLSNFNEIDIVEDPGSNYIPQFRYRVRLHGPEADNLSPLKKELGYGRGILNIWYGEDKRRAKKDAHILGDFLDFGVF